MPYSNFWIATVISFFLVLHGYIPENRKEDPQQNNPEAYAWILSDDHTSVKIGSAQGPDGAFFGSVDKILVQDTVIHVLDRERKQLSATSFSGHRLAEIGSEGQGPNEFMRPQALIEGNEGRVVVYDVLGAIKHFEFTTGSSEPHFKLHKTRNFIRSVFDICRAGDNLFIYPSNQPGTPTTEGEGNRYLLAYLPFTFDNAAAELSHFGARPSPMEDVPEQFTYAASRGTIHCTNHNRILAAHLLDNVVDIYDRSGQEVGSIRFESLPAPTFEVIRYDGADWSRMHFQDAYKVASMVSLDLRHALVQFVYYPEDWSGRDFNRPLEHHTFVLDLHDQEATFLGTTEKTFHHVTDSLYVASTELPQPLVHIGSKQ